MDNLVRNDNLTLELKLSMSSHYRWYMTRLLTAVLVLHASLVTAQTIRLSSSGTASLPTTVENEPFGSSDSSAFQHNPQLAFLNALSLVNHVHPL